MRLRHVLLVTGRYGVIILFRILDEATIDDDMFPRTLGDGQFMHLMEPYYFKACALGIKENILDSEMCVVKRDPMEGMHTTKTHKCNQITYVRGHLWECISRVDKFQRVMNGCRKRRTRTNRRRLRRRDYTQDTRKFMSPILVKETDKAGNLHPILQRSYNKSASGRSSPQKKKNPTRKNKRVADANVHTCHPTQSRR